jgi:hypothetical protein
VGALYDLDPIQCTGDTHPALFFSFGSVAIPKLNDRAITKDQDLWVTRAEAIDAKCKIVAPVARRASFSVICKKLHGMNKFSPDSVGVCGLQSNGT